MSLVFQRPAIAVALENMPPARPLTHDLFKTVMETFHIVLSEIVITNLMDGVFYSKLICIQNGEEYEIDCQNFGCYRISHTLWLSYLHLRRYTGNFRYRFNRRTRRRHRQIAQSPHLFLSKQKNPIFPFIPLKSWKKC